MKTYKVIARGSLLLEGSVFEGSVYYCNGEGEMRIKKPLVLGGLDPNHHHYPQVAKTWAIVHEGDTLVLKNLSHDVMADVEELTNADK